MKHILIIFCLLSFSDLSAQKPDYADKEYDRMIFEYQMEQVKDHQIDKSTYLEYAKPFSKWDPRPINDSLVWSMEKMRDPSIIPNFFWGSFSKYYNVTLEEAKALPNNFLEYVYKSKATLLGYFEVNKEAFLNLTSLLQQSDNNIFLNQTNLQRVDNIFCENNEYWQYIIAVDSPFPISDSTSSIQKYEFTGSQKKILAMMKELGIYAIYINSNEIFFLYDGVLDNSFGLIYQKGDEGIHSNHLFNISQKDEIVPKYYFYIAR